ncbi:MAG: hypothetical protein WD005_01225, partial [Haliea sp.]
ICFAHGCVSLALRQKGGHFTGKTAKFSNISITRGKLFRINPVPGRQWNFKQSFLKGKSAG